MAATPAQKTREPGLTRSLPVWQAVGMSLALGDHRRGRPADGRRDHARVAGVRRASGGSGGMTGGRHVRAGVAGRELAG